MTSKEDRKGLALVTAIEALESVSKDGTHVSSVRSKNKIDQALRKIGDSNDNR